MNEEHNTTEQATPEANSTNSTPPTQSAPAAPTAHTNYLTPLAILAGFGMVAAALYFSGTPGMLGTAPGAREATAEAQGAPQDTLDKIRPVSEEDHIKGSPDAPVKIVEYSDFECPFCKQFHNTVNQVMDQYGDSGDVALVYRHFPLDQLHPVKARTAAVASECANDQGGNDAFWQFTDRYFELTLSNNRTDIETVIPQIVDELGLDAAAFDSCMESGKFDDRIKADEANAIATGGRGTPWSIIIAPNGKTFPVNGAQPLPAVLQLIELAKKEQ